MNDATRIKVTKRDTGTEYVAWPVEGGWACTINDGMVPGGIVHLSDEEFRRLFDYPSARPTSGMTPR